MKTEDKNSDRYIPATTASDGHTEASLRKMVIELRKQLQQKRNKAIDDVIGKLSIKVEFGYLEGLWEYIKSDLENLKV